MKPSEKMEVYMQEQFQQEIITKGVYEPSEPDLAANATEIEKAATDGIGHIPIIEEPTTPKYPHADYPPEQLDNPTPNEPAETPATEFDYAAYQESAVKALTNEDPNAWKDFREAHAQEHGDRPIDLRGANLIGANLEGADLRGVDIDDNTKLDGANMRGADLSGADLREAKLSGIDLEGAILTDAKMRGADLRGTNLSGADLQGADLRNVHYDENTNLMGVKDLDKNENISEGLLELYNQQKLAAAASQVAQGLNGVTEATGTNTLTPDINNKSPTTLGK